jgi:transposase InsO family protein
MLASFINKQKGDFLKVKSVILQDHLKQKPVSKFMNVGLTWQADIMEFETDTKGYSFVLTFVDTTTGQGDAYPLVFKEGDDIKKATETFLRKHKDKVRNLETDQGSEFVSKSFKELMAKYKINHRLTHIGKKSANAKIESYNLQLRKLINATLNSTKKESWRKIVNDAKDHINEYRKENYKQRKIGDFFKMPILPLRKEFLKPDTEVHVKKFKHDTMRYRAGNIKFDEQPRKVEQYMLRNGQTIKYKIEGINNTLFNRNELNLKK